MGAGVGAGVVSKGAVGMLDLSRTTKIVVSLALAGATMYGASTAKSGSALQGAYTGVAIVQTLEALKEIANTDQIKAKLDPATKFGQFGSKALGLSAALEYDEEGNYLPSGMNGAGLGRYNELDGLGFADDDYEDGLGFADDDYEDGLGYSVEEEQMLIEN